MRKIISVVCLLILSASLYAKESHLYLEKEDFRIGAEVDRKVNEIDRKYKYEK